MRTPGTGIRAVPGIDADRDCRPGLQVEPRRWHRADERAPPRGSADAACALPWWRGGSRPARAGRWRGDGIGTAAGRGTLRVPADAASRPRCHPRQDSAATGRIVSGPFASVEVVLAGTVANRFMSDGIGRKRDPTRSTLEFFNRLAPCHEKVCRAHVAGRCGRVWRNGQLFFFSGLAAVAFCCVAARCLHSVTSCCQGGQR